MTALLAVACLYLLLLAAALTAVIAVQRAQIRRLRGHTNKAYRGLRAPGAALLAAAVLTPDAVPIADQVEMWLAAGAPEDLR